MPTPQIPGSEEDLSFRRSLRYDIPAGIVVFLVAVPLCLGVALASGAPLAAGIIAGIVGGLVVPLISHSALGISGPAAGLTVIVLDAIGRIGFRAFLMAVVLAGLLQIVLSLIRAGIIGYYFPSSVITGMLAGIGIIIALKQIPHLVGYHTDWQGDIAYVEPSGETTLSALTDMLGAFHPGATLVAVFCLAILILWERPFLKRWKIFQWLPGPLVAVVAGALINLAFARFAPDWVVSSKHLVSLPVMEDLNQWRQFFTFPELKSLSEPATYSIAITLAVVASLETLLSVEAADKLDPYKRVTPTNQELFAQGTGNIVSGLVGGLPVTQVIVRSSANVQAGGKTKTATMVHGLLLLISAFFFASWLNQIPLASLAAILLLVGYKLASPKLFIRIYRDGWYQFIPFVVTIVGLVFTDLLTGVGIGMVAAIFFLLLENYKQGYSYHEKEADNRISITLTEQVTFLNKANLLEELNRIPPYKKVTIDGSMTRYIDHDVLEIIENFKSEAKFKHIQLTLVGLPIEGSLPAHPPVLAAVPPIKEKPAMNNNRTVFRWQAMRLLQHLFDNNRRWAETMERNNPGIFQRLAQGQSPKYLWIGCSDSRIPANEVIGLMPGEVFVHRNVANLVIHTDMNLLSVLQYAVEVLKIEHAIICGHYGCGGVQAAMRNDPFGLIDNWLRFIKDIYHHHANLLEPLPEEQRADRLCELNVIQQVANVCHTTIVQDAWRRGQPLAVHGWIYDIQNGLLKDLNLCISAPEQLPDIYHMEPPFG